MKTLAIAVIPQDPRCSLNALISGINLDCLRDSQLYLNRYIGLGLQLNGEVWKFRRPSALDLQTSAMEKSAELNRMGFFPRVFLIPVPTTNPPD